MFFHSNPVPFNGQTYQKQKGPETSDQSLFRLWSKFTKISLLVMYYLTMFDGVNIKRLLSYSKNYTCKFMQANSWHHKLFQFHLYFRIWEVWKGRGKITEIWISQEQKELFEVHSFWRAIIWWKNKKLIKNSGHKLLRWINTKCIIPLFHSELIFNWFHLNQGWPSLSSFGGR